MNLNALLKVCNMGNRFKQVREKFLEITKATEDPQLREQLAVFGIFLETLQPIITLQDFYKYLEVLENLNKDTLLAANMFVQALPHSFCNDQYECSRYLEQLVEQNSQEIRLALIKAVFQSIGKE
jgi:hypothetical protein